MNEYLNGRHVIPDDDEMHAILTDLNCKVDHALVIKNVYLELIEYTRNNIRLDKNIVLGCIARNAGI